MKLLRFGVFAAVLITYETTAADFAADHLLIWSVLEVRIFFPQAGRPVVCCCPHPVLGIFGLELRCFLGQDGLWIHAGLSSGMLLDMRPVPS